MYFGLTHHKFSFIVTPDEFQTVFRRDDYSFIYTNQRAGLDYAFTPQETVLPLTANTGSGLFWRGKPYPIKHYGQ